jgi:hypothetical protein
MSFVLICGGGGMRNALRNALNHANLQTLTKTPCAMGMNEQ